MACPTVGQDCQKCKETSIPLANKKQKMGEHAENIKFSLDSQLKSMFSTCSPIFCCLSTRGGFFTFLAILAYCMAVDCSLDPKQLHWQNYKFQENWYYVSKIGFGLNWILVKYTFVHWEK